MLDQPSISAWQRPLIRIPGISALSGLTSLVSLLLLCLSLWWALQTALFMALLAGLLGLLGLMFTLALRQTQQQFQQLTSTQTLERWHWGPWNLLERGLSTISPPPSFPPLPPLALSPSWALLSASDPHPSPHQARVTLAEHATWTQAGKLEPQHPQPLDNFEEVLLGTLLWLHTQQIIILQPAILTLKRWATASHTSPVCLLLPGPQASASLLSGWLEISLSRLTEDWGPQLQHHTQWGWLNPSPTVSQLLRELVSQSPFPSYQLCQQIRIEAHKQGWFEQTDEDQYQPIEHPARIQTQHQLQKLYQIWKYQEPELLDVLKGEIRKGLM